MKTLTIDAKVNNLTHVLRFINDELSVAGCRPKAKLQLDVAAEEIFVNIASYAYGSETGEASVSISIQGEPPVAEITFVDSGVRFDPFSIPDPDITLNAIERSIGGLGIYMVKKTMDEVHYEYRDGLNLTTIRKKI